MLGFNGSMPGPELRVCWRERVNIDVENGLEDGTAVHWHGIRLENKMDRVPMLTQELIEPSDTRIYTCLNTTKKGGDEKLRDNPGWLYA